MPIEAPNLLFLQGGTCPPDVQQADGERQQTTTPGGPLSAIAVYSVLLLPAHRGQAVVAVISSCSCGRHAVLAVVAAQASSQSLSVASPHLCLLLTGSAAKSDLDKFLGAR